MRVEYARPFDDRSEKQKDSIRSRHRYARVKRRFPLFYFTVSNREATSKENISVGSWSLLHSYFLIKLISVAHEVVVWLIGFRFSKLIVLYWISLECIINLLLSVNNFSYWFKNCVHGKLYFNLCTIAFHFIAVIMFDRSTIVPNYGVAYTSIP